MARISSIYRSQTQGIGWLCLVLLERSSSSREAMLRFANVGAQRVPIAKPDVCFQHLLPKANMLSLMIVFVSVLLEVFGVYNFWILLSLCLRSGGFQGIRLDI